MGSFVFTLSWLAFCYACIRMIERRPIPFAYLTDGSTYGASASRALEISTALVPAAAAPRIAAFATRSFLGPNWQE